FSFKQQDSKSLSAKALLAEIKETSEEKSIEDDIRQRIAPKKQNFISHQEFKYSDLEIHEDLYDIMKYSIKQSCSPEQIDEALKICTTFVESMLSVPPPSMLGNNNGVKENGFSNTDLMEHKSESSISTAPEKSHIIFVPESHYKIEKEMTGGLSPNRYLKKSKLEVYIDPGVRSTHKFKTTIMNKNCYRNKHQKGGLQNGHNVDENGDDSGSESADAEDLSPEDHDTMGQGKVMVDGMGEDICPITEHILRRVKPLMLHVPETFHNKEKKSRVFYKNDDFHVFFRLHPILYTRLEEANEKSLVEKCRGSMIQHQMIHMQVFLELLYSFLDDTIDSAKYEDECRVVLGTWSFPVFTLDKHTDKLIELLFAITMDDINNKLLGLYAYENLRSGERFVDELYSANTSLSRKVRSKRKMYNPEAFEIFKFSDAVGTDKSGVHLPSFSHKIVKPMMPFLALLIFVPTQLIENSTMFCCLCAIPLADDPWFLKREFAEYFFHVGLGHVPRLTRVAIDQPQTGY
ncbi:paired amphipathic helix protein Sin3-like protein 4 isoform X2, partial [Tanacetum coccineum]